MLILDAIRRYKIVAIARGVPPDRLMPAAEALYEGGIRLLEVTFSQKDPDALLHTPASIRSLCKSFGEKMLIGAGTVMTAEQVNAAADAGAGYIISPNFSRPVVEETLKRGHVSIPGVMTPTEMVSAYEAGAQLVKLFPAGDLGVGYMKSMMAPLSHIPVVATGGIDETKEEVQNLINGDGSGRIQR